jgi:hypothetical protein
MGTDNLNERQSVSDAKESTERDRRTQAASLVEMGSVSKETKGIIHGIELGFTPRSY